MRRCLHRITHEQNHLVVSIVSHGHHEQVQRLLEGLSRDSADYIARVIVTHNIPEPRISAPQSGWPFKVEVLCNPTPYGFGTNHNKALQSANEPFFCVLNPDVELIEGHEPFASLLQAAALPQVGCAYPQQINEAGHVQDSARQFPSPIALLQRWILNRKDQRVDWVNAACIVMPLPAWRAVGGFDERYFMYGEDVDFCLRLRLLGFVLKKAHAQVVHVGQRDSHRRIRYLFWHVRSLLRLWSSPIHRKLREQRNK